MIKAKGKKDGKNLSVEYNNGKFTFNGKADDILNAELDILLKSGLPIFGTYISDDTQDEINIVGKLREYFFDNEADVKSDPEIIGDWEKGVVY